MTTSSTGKQGSRRRRGLLERFRESELPEKIFLAFVGALLASWLFPALTRQWQDRTKEIELKSTITTQLTDAATSTIQSGRLLMFRLLPQDQEYRVARQALGELLASSSSPPSPEQLQQTEDNVLQTRLAALIARADRFNQARESWVKASTAARARFRAYFEYDQALTAAWSMFSDRLLDWFRLSGSLREDQRLEAATQLASYFSTADDVDWEIVAQKPLSLSGDARREFNRDYEAVGRLLTARLNELVEAVIAADSSAFSTDFGDLVADLVPW